MQLFPYYLLPAFFTACLFLTGNNLPGQAPQRVFRFEYEGETVNMQTIMHASGTSGVSMAVDNRQLDSAFVARLPETAELSTETVFPAGAASALPVCVAILQLVERGVIDLDAPANNYLGNNPLNGGEQVTVRDLLLMKPRLKSDYKPAGYFAGTPLPTLAVIAEGFRFRGIRKPSKSTEYGGWVFLQLLLEHHYGEPLATIIQREVFGPLCLENIFYATELNDEQLRQAAAGHLDNKSSLSGGYKRYVAQAAAGLWTNAADYSRLVRELLEIKRGKENSILHPATVEMAFAHRYGHRSLLVHMSFDGNPYWGGNARGFYFTMQANIKEDWVAVVAMNRDLNWRLGNSLVWQLGMLGKQWRSEDRLGIIHLPGEEETLVAELEHQAFAEGVKTILIPAGAGLPAEITGTPAFIYQSPAGRAIYGGKHNDLEAITRFVRLNKALPKKYAADERSNVFGRRRGRQTIIMPVKLTAPSGVAAPAELPAPIIAELYQQLSHKAAFTQMKQVGLNAQDRRVYLDVHSYRTVEGAYQLTYAIFSQFNCHTPVFTNYGDPVTVSTAGDGLEALTTRMAADVAKMMRPELGLIPTSLPAVLPVVKWAELGWGLEQSVATTQATTKFEEPIAITGAYRATLTEEDAPGVFFSFPSPLDRYSGEVRELVADFNFSANGTSVTGRVDLPVAAISTTSGSLDTYVLGDVLNSTRHPEASLTFTEVRLAADWRMNAAMPANIPAVLNIRGKDHPVTIRAEFRPENDGGLSIAADFDVDFRKVFGRSGPDGPEAIRHQLDFTARFRAHPLTSK